MHIGKDLCLIEISNNSYHTQSYLHTNKLGTKPGLGNEARHIFAHIISENESPDDGLSNGAHDLNLYWILMEIQAKKRGESETEISWYFCHAHKIVDELNKIIE